jgi:hypothetical protein
MSSTPRHLQFAVGTTLLGASLSLGCAGKAQHDEPPHVNTAPVEPPTNTAPIADPVETPPSETPPSETPADETPPADAKAPDATVNVRTVEPEREPKRVNTRPDDSL